jgi:tight adherence protein C
MLIGLPLATSGWLVVRYLTVRQRTRERLLAAYDMDDALAAVDEQHGFLTRWLALAGYRGPNPSAAFIGFTLLGVGIGLAFALVFTLAGVIGRVVDLAGRSPSALGHVLVPLAYVAPWLFVVILGALPLLTVRRARRQRELSVEQDMPLYLDLLATLGEAGLAFDMALDRILITQPADRPLAQELRLFQKEVLAGRPRIHCLRRLARRLDVITFSIFVSALVQAEQTGMGVAEVLRRQAEDLRERRREQALAVAMSLPVKLLFPLVICFLPGIFVVTLGPAFYQVFQLADNIVRTRTLR